MMKESTPMGMNRTGVQMSPFDNTRMQQSGPLSTPHTQPDENTAASAMRSAYIESADPVGSVPVPGTVTGAMTTTFAALTGNNPRIFIDQLGARLAFERTGARLYDALITKFQSADTEPPASMTLEDLQRLRAEEARHFSMIVQAIETLGADPTAETPCADLTGVESMGLVKVLSDPRTTITQSLHAILIAELADQSGWEVLIALANEHGQAAMADDFTVALNDEQRHLQLVQQWYQEAILGPENVQNDASGTAVKPTRH